MKGGEEGEGGWGEREGGREGGRGREGKDNEFLCH